MANSVQRFFSGLRPGGKIVLLIVVGALIWGGSVAYKKAFPPAVAQNKITTKASTSLPPLAYDKSANAPARQVPSFNDPVVVQSPEIRGELMGWNAQMGLMYGVGGTSTSKGSIAEEEGLNIKLSVQNSTSQQGNDLYAFAQALKNGETNPTTGATFIAWMGDGVPSYFTGLEARLKKDLGPDYVPVVVDFAGASYGEDKWLVKKKYQADARGSVNIGVIRDGDWNVAVIKSQLNGWDVNNDNTTYDRTKVNFIPAPNDDYMEAAKAYVGGQQIKLALVENGHRTGKDTTVNISGLVTWFPGDITAVQKKGGLVCIASTKDFAAQMGCAIIMIKKWAKDNRPLVEKFCEMVGKAGDQVKSHDDALQFGAKVADAVYKDEIMHEDDWYKGYKSYDITDDDGNTVNIGGSRVFNLADAANYVGVDGTKDNYKSVYNTFGKICTEAYPSVVPSFPDYNEVTDWSYLKAAYEKNKGTGGGVSKVDFSRASKGQVVGDANYSINFATGSAVINPSSFKILDDIANKLVIASDLFIDVSGHTDNTGDPGKNQELSQARAKAVADYINSKNEDFAQRIHPEGLGESRPFNPNADQNSPTERARNRRVEIVLNKANQ